MKLFNYYSIDECRDKKKLFERLDQFKNDGKIDYQMDGLYLFELEDIDLEEKDIKELNDLFDDQDVFPYLENSLDEEEGDEYDDEYDSEDDY